MILATTLSCPPSPSSISIISSSCDDVDDDDDSVDYCCCSPHHLQAQRLNNTAATCIENGQTYYEKAITILTKALRICEKEQDQEHEHAYAVCSCHYCSIDGCIDINDDNDTVITEDNNDGTTIYQNPVYVYEGHNMASSLIHIISFNLAIAHHLTAAEIMTTSTNIENENENSNNENEPDKESLINKALQFYELAYECNLSNTCSVRFDTIICNNLSHMYRSQEQAEEQEQQETLQEQNDEQPLPQSRRTNADDDVDDEKSLELDELLEFEYYSQEEEQEAYAHNRSLISLLTTTVSTAASSTTTTTTTSPAPSFTKTGIKPQPQRITAAALEDEKSVELEELLELEYYTPEEEQEEYAHNRSLISLLTTTVSTTASSSCTTTSRSTNSILAPAFITKTSIPATRTMMDRNDGFLRNVVSSSDYSGCKSSALLPITQPHYQEQTEEQEYQEKLREQNEEQEQPQPQRITAAALEDEKSVEFEELLELEYYTPEEETEEYAHNRSLISLLTTAVSTTVPSSSTATSTISSAPSFTKTISSARSTSMIGSNEGFLQHVVSSSSDCSDCNKSSSLLLIKQQGGRGGEVCGITDNHDSIQSLTYATCA